MEREIIMKNKLFQDFIDNYYFSYTVCLILSEDFIYNEIKDEKDGIRDQLYYEMGYLDER
jgi:hypothetical protein